MDWAFPAGAFAVVFVAALAGTGTLARTLARRAILDHPNERSSHARPKPRGGGIAVVAVLVAAWAAIAALADDTAAAMAVLLAAAAGLSLVSWLDDLRGLSPLWRLAAQVVAVAAGVTALADGPVLQGLLPPALDRLAAAILWLWFINLFNFMDGIDGITGTETACLGGGLFAVTVLAGSPAGGPAALYAVTAAAAALGFLWWNWEPARVFLGDVGSVPLGFLLGWLLLDAAAAGLWAVAVILPLYYLADATITLLRRLVAGERIWEAHRQHFYQRAVQRGLSHAGVVRSILTANLALIALALAAGAGRPGMALAGAAAVVAALLFYLARARGKAGDARAGSGPAGAGG